MSDATQTTTPEPEPPPQLGADETPAAIGETDPPSDATEPAVDETTATDSETVTGDGSGDSAAEQPPAPVSHEVPIHRAVCQVKGCGISLVYRPTSTGAGFQVLEVSGVEPGTLFGGPGAQGTPICPRDGHGEMTLADEQLPAAEAFAKADEQIKRAREPKQPRLPGTVPEFNFEGTFKVIVEKRHEVKELEREFEKRDEARKKAKAALDEANAELGEMIDDFEERMEERQLERERQERLAREGHPEGTNLVRCLFERQQEGQRCPLCVADGPTFVRGQGIAAKNSERHVEQVAEFLEDQALEQLVERLKDVAGIVPTHNAIRDWTPEQRAEIETYLQQLAAGEKSVTRPSAFASSHLAAAIEDGAKVQTCRECGSTLLVFGEAEVDPQPYQPGTLVGADCPGAEIETSRYPTRHPKGTKKPRAERQKADKAEGPAKPKKARKK